MGKEKTRDVPRVALPRVERAEPQALKRLARDGEAGEAGLRMRLLHMDLQLAHDRVCYAGNQSS